MTYLKTLITPLIALTTLALLTACAGGVTVNNNNPVVKTDDPKTTALCITNPFGTGCTLTPTEEEAFCRDASKTTDTKAADCSPTVSRLCIGNVFDEICPTAPTQQQQEAFCGDASKTPDGKTTNCAPTVVRVCGDDPFNTGLCFADNTYAPTRFQIRATCTSEDEDLRNDLCSTIVVATCTENPFLDECLVGDVGADTGTYGLARAKQITENCVGEDGTGFGNVFHRACNGIMDYENERTRIMNACTAETANTPSCRPNVVALVCNGNPYNMDLCFDDIDYSAKRAEELAECRRDNGRLSCVGAAAYEDTCTDNPFQENLCFIGTTYMGDRDTQTQNCRNKVADAPNCPDALIAVCNADKFDAYCTDAPAYRPAQLNECVLATATTAQCNMVFAPEFAMCLADPFSPACDTEPTFTDSKVSVRTSRFSFCKTAQPNDNRCAGYRTCNDPMALALATCGAVFQPVRVAFCKVPTSAFNAGCVDDLKNAEAQLNFCKLLGTNPFTGDCAGRDFKEARVAFCLRGTNAMNNQDCKDDLLEEGLVPPPDVCEEQMASASCANAAALPTYPTLPEETSPTAGDAFANGFLNVTFIAPTDGTPLLNPDGTDNTTIDTTNFPATTRLVSVEVPTVGFTQGIPAPKFGRRGGLGSSDADGFVWFFILKGADGTEESQRSHHATILPTTNLGAPLTEPPMTAVWPGHFYYNSSVPDPTDFFITFESGLASNQIGRIGFANPTKDGIGTGADRPQFARDRGLELNMVAVNPEETLSVTFDAKGVISGKIVHATFSTGTSVTGLIGQEGLVAISIIRSNFSGFTATNPDGGAIPSVDACIADPNSCFVTYTDWADATTPVPITSFTTSQFASTRALTLKTAGVSGLVDIFTNLNTAQFGGEALGGDATNGFIVIPNRGSNFAGIASTTNLGVPLGAQPTGTWNGSFQVYEDGAPTRVNSDFTLTVTYGGSNLGSGKTGSLSATIANTDYSFVGEFNASGVIDGTVTHTDTTNSTGELQGLIGADGAVGVFISSPTQTQPFGGGFVACPYNTTTNKCESSQ